MSHRFNNAKVPKKTPNTPIIPNTPNTPNTPIIPIIPKFLISPKTTYSSISLR
jgi:hypothetical protein